VRINVLDHGYVKLVESWGHGDEDAGDDERGIVEAARQSTQGSFRGWESDLKLLRFLHANRHSTPFEFAGMTVEVQAPIVVFREWHRHRTQSYSEMSARYSPLPDADYLPTLSRVTLDEAGANRQAQAARGSTRLTEEFAGEWGKKLEEKYRRDQEFYQWGLDSGVPKELARLGMPVGRYSRMRASASLRNWLGFLTLRLDPKAQWEIRQYAEAVGKLVAGRFPRTWSLFVEGRQP